MSITMMYPFFEIITILEPNDAIVCCYQDVYMHNLIKKKEKLRMYIGLLYIYLGYDTFNIIRKREKGRGREREGECD